MPFHADKLPRIYGSEAEIEKVTAERKAVLYLSYSDIAFGKIEAAFGLALHMHQPTILGHDADLKKARLINNLQYMLENQHLGDNHNAPVFLRCYRRMSDFVRELVAQNRSPRVMLDYSGNLLWGLEQMGEKKVLDNLRSVTADKKYYGYVEWLGTMWSHAVVSSTPIPDIQLHIRAWQKHFAAIFGSEALERVTGFSPPELALPIHPDVCYEYVKALKECGFRWLLVQEHTVENLDGSGIRRPYLPHKLRAKNSLGELQEITVLIKTQGSDAKLIGQMQPYAEARTKKRESFLNQEVCPYVLQIGDGENGGVMMNEFPQAYKQAFAEVGTGEVAALNGSEYLEYIQKLGIKAEDFIPVEPVTQHKIWEFVRDYAPGAAERAITQAKARYGGFNLDRASWTNDRSWVKGYQDVLDPINKLSVEFHRRFDGETPDTPRPVYQEALLYLLLSQTSCFRYWGQGVWTDYAKEICRRGMEILKKR